MSGKLRIVLSYNKSNSAVLIELNLSTASGLAGLCQGNVSGAEDELKRLKEEKTSKCSSYQ